MVKEVSYIGLQSSSMRSMSVESGSIFQADHIAVVTRDEAGDRFRLFRLSERKFSNENF